MEDKILKCSNCGSNEVAVQQKGFDGGKAVIGGWLLGGIGFLMAGYKNSKEVTAICSTCKVTWNYNEVLSIDQLKFKESFYRLYKLKDYDQAEVLYLSNCQYDEITTDVHLAYAKIKAEDRRSQMINLGFMAFVIIMLILIVITN